MKRGGMRAGIAVIIAVMLTGCGDIPNLNEQQEDMIAEYAGGVLLRYSHKYDLRLVSQDVDEDGIEDAKSAVSGEAVATETPVVTQEPEPEPEEPTAKPSDTDEPEPEPEPTEEPEVSLDELYGIKGLTFSYNTAEYTNRYPENSDTVEITPDEGQILYVVSFNIKNTSNRKIKVDLTTRPFHYELDVGGEKVLPAISLLPNGGLNYLMTKIMPGETEEAVLIFNLDRSKDGTKGNTLTITEGDNTATVKL